MNEISVTIQDPKRFAEEMADFNTGHIQRVDPIKVYGPLQETDIKKLFKERIEAVKGYKGPSPRSILIFNTKAREFLMREDGKGDFTLLQTFSDDSPLIAPFFYLVRENSEFGPFEQTRVDIESLDPLLRDGVIEKEDRERVVVHFG